MESSQSSSKLSAEVDGKDIEDTFGPVLQLYHDYSGILETYRKTKFMQDLYNDIKAQVQKIKVILNTELDQVKSSPPPLVQE